MTDRDLNPSDHTVEDEPVHGWCGWSIFTPQKQTWLGFVLAWICVLIIIALTAVLARIGA